MHAADCSSSSSSSSSATHLPFLLTPAQTTESQNDVGSWEPLQTIASSLYTTTHTTIENKNCADEEGAAIPGTAKAPAATSPHNNNHLHNTLLLLFSVRLHVRPSVCVCLSPEFKGGSFSAHKLFNRLKMEKNKKQKKKGSGKAQQQQ
jgi:hypothetical protein